VIPADGVSINCDNTYQRFRLEDGGAAGRTVFLDNWINGAWTTVWALSGGDPMERQIETENVGLMSFGECRKFIVVPLRYSGSGAALELHIFVWDGASVTEVLNVWAEKGGWKPSNDTFTINKAVFLYGEPNCCPCYTQVDTYKWNGSQFVVFLSSLVPNFSGDPPPECKK
jgi:hypothetical protein